MRGCGIVAAAAFARTATWPSSAPGRGGGGSSSNNSRITSRACAFVVSAAPSVALSVVDGNPKAPVSWCRSWTSASAAASAERRQQSRITGGMRGDTVGTTVRLNHAFNGECALSSFPAAAGGAAGRDGLVLPSSVRRRHTCHSTKSSRATLALTAASRGGDIGDAGPGRVEIDPDSVARAREAAKNDDYEWFMEFIGGDEEDGQDDIGRIGDGGRWQRAGDVGGLSNDYRSSDSSGSSGSRRQTNPPHGSSGQYDSDSRNGGIDYTTQATAGPRPAARVQPPGRRPRPPPTGRGFQPSPAVSSPDDRIRGPSGGSSSCSSRRRYPADTAYDYDLDEEYDQEPGRGGWDYDPGLSVEIGARKRGVEIDKVRAKTKPASMKMPLEDDLEVVEEGPDEGECASQEEAAEFVPVGPEKANVLTEELGYTAPEVACMDPDMAELAIERRIRRPAAGMPPDWVAVEMPPPPPQSGVPSSSQTFFGEGATGTAGSWAKSGRKGGGGGGGADSGALDLEAILGRDGYDGFEDVDGGSSSGGRRQEATRRGRPQPSAPSGWQGVPPSGGQQPQQRRRPDSSYYYAEDSDGGEYDRRQRRGGNLGGGRVSGGFYDDFGSNGDDCYEEERRGRRTPSNSNRQKRQKKKPELNPAERYEREMFGELGRDDDGDDDDSDGGGSGDRLWTGVGPDGPWPTMEEFTKLLREETEVRLGLVGPWAAEVVAIENRFRLQAYEKWLEILDKGIGETLEEAGVFDASFAADDDDDDYAYDNGGRGRGASASSRGGRQVTNTNNLYDDYTSYGGYSTGRGSEGGGASRKRDAGGREQEWDYDRAGWEDGFRRQQGRQSREWDEHREPSKRMFDVGSFLMEGAQSIIRPGAGMEEKAAEFERRYPGETFSNVLGDEDGGGDYFESWGSGRNRADRERVAPQQQRQRGARRESRGGSYEDDGGVEYRGKGQRGRARDRGSPRPGYIREDEDYEN